MSVAVHYRFLDVRSSLFTRLWHGNGLFSQLCRFSGALRHILMQFVLSSCCRGSQVGGRSQQLLSVVARLATLSVLLPIDAQEKLLAEETAISMNGNISLKASVPVWQLNYVLYN